MHHPHMASQSVVNTRFSVHPMVYCLICLAPLPLHPLHHSHPPLPTLAITATLSHSSPEPYVRRNPDSTVTVCWNFTQGFCRHEQCWYFHPPPHIVALFTLMPPPVSSPLLPQVRNRERWNVMYVLTGYWLSSKKTYVANIIKYFFLCLGVKGFGVDFWSVIQCLHLLEFSYVH